MTVHLEPPESRAVRRARLLALWSAVAAVAVAVLAWLLDIPLW